jgi:hypothetical protein
LQSIDKFIKELLDESTKRIITVNKIKAELLLEISQIEKGNPTFTYVNVASVTYVNVASGKHAQFQLSIIKLNQFLNDCRAVLAHESTSARYLSTSGNWQLSITKLNQFLNDCRAVLAHESTSARYLSTSGNWQLSITKLNQFLNDCRAVLAHESTSARYLSTSGNWIKCKTNSKTIKNSTLSGGKSSNWPSEKPATL